MTKDWPVLKDWSERIPELYQGAQLTEDTLLVTIFETTKPVQLSADDPKKVKNAILRGEQSDEQDLGVALDRLPDCRVRVITHAVGDGSRRRGLWWTRRPFRKRTSWSLYISPERTLREDLCIDTSLAPWAVTPEKDFVESGGSS